MTSSRIIRMLGMACISALPALGLAQPLPFAATSAPQPVLPQQAPGQALPPVGTSLPHTAIPQADSIKSVTTPRAIAKSSMGTSGFSIFFTPNQITAMEAALIDFESRPTTNAPQANLEVDLLKPKEPPKIVEPPIYPVFYLSSIAYHSPKDWSIWVSGHKITSAHNITDLTVLSVSETQASFVWKPVFKEALATRKTANAFAPLDKVKNKLTKIPQFSYDAESGIVSFTLKTNQSFNAAYMNSFEGFIESPPLPAMVTEPTAQADNSAQPVAAIPKP